MQRCTDKRSKKQPILYRKSFENRRRIGSGRHSLFETAKLAPKMPNLALETANLAAGMANLALKMADRASKMAAQGRPGSSLERPRDGPGRPKPPKFDFSTIFGWFLLDFSSIFCRLFVRFLIVFKLLWHGSRANLPSTARVRRRRQRRAIHSEHLGMCVA